MQILVELYLGGIRLGKRMCKRNKQNAKALDETIKAGDVLTASLSAKQKELFADYISAQLEVTALTACETICYGFKVGTKIILDVLTEGELKKI